MSNHFDEMPGIIYEDVESFEQFANLHMQSKAQIRVIPVVEILISFQPQNYNDPGYHEPSLKLYPIIMRNDVREHAIGGINEVSSTFVQDNMKG